MDIPQVVHRFVPVNDVRVFYREAGPHDAPVLLLLHGDVMIFGRHFRRPLLAREEASRTQ